MKKLNESVLNQPRQLPLKVVQFGEGNFLRAFVDWIIDILNEKTDFNGGIYLIQPLENGLVYKLTDQDCLYHVWLNGINHGQSVNSKRLITSVIGGLDPYKEYEDFINLGKTEELEFIISNTTEAGIAFNENDKSMDTTPAGFPGKVTALLYSRFRHFKGDRSKGLIFIPCELIDKNGDALKSNIIKYARRYELGNEFIDWVNNANTFCNSLVDRIVPGYPADSIKQIQDELQLQDDMIVKAEPFHLWVIEGPDWMKEKFPAEKAGLHVKFVNDLSPYRTRKVRILNGAHTSIVPLAYLSGLRTVEDIMNDDKMNTFLRDTIFDEIIPTLDLPKSELDEFANDVLERFQNPFIRHELKSIALNSISKFKVRVLPSLQEFHSRFNKLPEKLIHTLAALIVFYKGNWNGEKLPIKDSPDVVDFFSHIWEESDLSVITKNTLSRSEFWDQDLSKIEGLTEAVSAQLRNLLSQEVNSSITYV